MIASLRAGRRFLAPIELDALEAAERRAREQAIGPTPRFAGSAFSLGRWCVVRRLDQRVGAPRRTVAMREAHKRRRLTRRAEAKPRRCRIPCRAGPFGQQQGYSKRQTSRPSQGKRRNSGAFSDGARRARTADLLIAKRVAVEKTNTWIRLYQARSAPLVETGRTSDNGGSPGISFDLGTRARLVPNRRASRGRAAGCPRKQRRRSLVHERPLTQDSARLRTRRTLAVSRFHCGAHAPSYPGCAPAPEAGLLLSAA